MFPPTPHNWRMHMPATPQPRKGRGAGSNESGRFETEKRVPFDDGWGSSEGEPARLATTLSVDATRTIIARNDSPDIGFDRSINPYRGCEHGCIYCYARPSHAYLGLSPGLDFETRIFYKPNAAALLRDELRKKGYVCRPIALGSNTDPYQPAERKLGVTRSILEVLSEFHHPVTIVTKGALIQRDIDILSDMAREKLAVATVSVTTLDRDLARTMEPRAATPERRIETIAALSKAGIPTGVLSAPMIPALNDRELEAILGRARDTRAGQHARGRHGGERRGQRKAARSARCRSDLPRLCRSLAGIAARYRSWFSRCPRRSAPRSGYRPQTAHRPQCARRLAPDPRRRARAVGPPAQGYSTKPRNPPEPHLKYQVAVFTEINRRLRPVDRQRDRTLGRLAAESFCCKSAATAAKSEGAAAAYRAIRLADNFPVKMQKIPCSEGIWLQAIWLRLARVLLPKRADSDAGIVQPRDLAAGKTEHLREHLIGMLAEARRRPGRLARRCAEFKRQARHRIAADPGLLDCGEERVGGRAARIVPHQLDKILKRAPQDAAAGKGRGDFRQRLAGAPPRDQRSDCGARLVAAGLGVKIDLHHLADHRQFVGEPGHAAERPPLPRRQRDDHDPPSVGGRKIAPEAAVEIVADRRPRPAVDADIADVAEMPNRREHDIGQGGDNLLPLAGARPVAFGREQRCREIKTGGDVPGRQHIVDRRAAPRACRPGHHRKPTRRVDCVVDGGAAVAIADQPEQDHILALCLKAGVIETGQWRQVGKHDTGAGTGRGRDCLRDFAPLRLVERQRNRALRLVHPGPIEARAVFGYGPAVEVDTAADRVDADDLGAKLRHRHAAERRGDKGAQFDDAQIRQKPVHRRASVCRLGAIEPKPAPRGNLSRLSGAEDHSVHDAAGQEREDAGDDQRTEEQAQHRALMPTHIVLACPPTRHRTRS